MAERWPFVGRDEEVGVLLESLQTSSAMIAGVAGVGKSRLAAELVDRLEASGQRVARCVANRSTLTIPFGAMVHLLPSVGTRSTDVTQLLSSARLDVAETYRGGLLLVDDAHLLDEASASLVHHLVRDGQVRVLVVVRSSEPAPDAIEVLSKDGLVDRIDLQPLSRREARSVLEMVCQGAVSDPTVDRFFAISEGNAMFLRELVLEALDRGELAEVDGSWTWSGSVRGTVRLVTMVERHMNRSSPSVRRVLELVALVEPLPVTLLETLTSANAVEAAEREGLVAVSRDGVDVRVRHPLFGEVISAHMDAGAFRRNVRELSAAMLADGGRATPTQVTRLAILHLESNLPASTELFSAAARHAIASGDSVLGERLARAAVAVDDGSYTSVMSLAIALGAQNRFAEVAEILGPLEGTEPDDASIAELSYARMRALLFGGLAPPAAARAVVDEARARVTDEGHSSMLDSALAEIALNESDLTTAGRLAVGVLDATAATSEAQLLAAHVASLANTLSGRSVNGTRLAERYWPSAVSAAVDVPGARGWLLLDRWLGLVYSGQLDRAFDMCHELAAEPMAGPPGFEGSVALFEGRLHLLVGRPASAEARLRDAIAILRVEDPRHYLEWALGLCGAACALQGRRADGRELRDEGDRRADTFRRLFDSDRMLASTWVLAAEGQSSAARHLAERIGRRSVGLGQLSFGTLALHDALRLGCRNVATTLVESAHRCDGPVAAAIAAHASAVLSGSGDDLASAADGLADAGLHVAAAEAHIHAAGSYHRAGRRVSAVAASAEADALLAGCEGIRTPVIETRLVIDAGLTPRELEIVTLAAGGASNNEIAARLYTSIRTVEGHLLRAYRKLGISRRQELPGRLAAAAENA